MTATHVTPVVERELDALQRTLERLGPLIESASVSAVESWPSYIFDLEPFVVTVAIRPGFVTRPRFATREEAEAYREAASEIIERAT